VEGQPEQRENPGGGQRRQSKRLGFGKVTQDGDCEGAIVLDRLPSKAEAAVIRDIIGVPKRVELSEGQLANLRAPAAANAFKPILSPSSTSPDASAIREPETEKESVSP
jgi:hypothetical protein